MDLSALSDSDLMALKNGSLDKMSDDGLKALKSASQPSMAQRVGDTVKGVARAVDAYTGAPVRSAIGAALEGKPIMEAGLQQLGNNPDLAPTGKALAEKMGVPDTEVPIEAMPGPLLKMAKLMKYINPSYSDAAGGAIDQGANVLNIIPALGGAKRAAGMLAEAIPAASKIAEVGSALADIPGNAALKAAGVLTNKPTKAIETYAKRGGEVNQLLSDFGGEVPTAADAMKDKILGNIKETKAQLSSNIEKALSQTNAAPVDVNPIVQKLVDARNKLNPHYNAGDISQINEMIDAIGKNTQNGQMGLKDLFDTKNFLQTRSNGSFINNGQLFISGDKASKAANDARKVAADTLHTHPSAGAIKDADAVYSDLHHLDDKMSVSLLGEGKPEQVFASAGGGQGNVHQANLRQLGEITGTNPIADAELIHSAKYMKPNPDHFELNKTLLKLVLDAKRKGGEALNAVPTGASSGINAILQGAGEALSSPMRSPADKGSAMQRRMSNSK